MAIFHSSVKTVSRSQGRSATAAAAYRSGTLIRDDRTGQVHDYTRRSGVEHKELILPRSAPTWARDREQLWNAAEKAETRKNSTVAREFEIALPAELNWTDRRLLAQAFARELTGRYGVAVDLCIHAPGREGDQRNHHAHLLCTTRQLGPDGFGAKTRQLDDRKSGEVERLREYLAEQMNKRLQIAGKKARVDHRSLEDQRAEAITKRDRARAEELNRAPTVHLGPHATAMERKGRTTERGEHCRERQRLSVEARHLADELPQLERQAAREAREAEAKARQEEATRQAQEAAEKARQAAEERQRREATRQAQEAAEKARQAAENRRREAEARKAREAARKAEEAAEKAREEERARRLQEQRAQWRDPVQVMRELEERQAQELAALIAEADQHQAQEEAKKAEAKQRREELYAQAWAALGRSGPPLRADEQAKHLAEFEQMPLSQLRQAVTAAYPLSAKILEEQTPAVQKAVKARKALEAVDNELRHPEATAKASAEFQKRAIERFHEEHGRIGRWWNRKQLEDMEAELGQHQAEAKRLGKERQDLAEEWKRASILEQVARKAARPGAEQEAARQETVYREMSAVLEQREAKERPPQQERSRGGMELGG